MATQVDGNVKSFTCGSVALTPYLRVKLSSGTVVVAGLGETAIGVTLQEAAVGAQVPVKLASASGTVKVTAAGAFSAGALLYAAASGKVDDTVTGKPEYVALGAAAAANNVVEALPVGALMPNVADSTLASPIVIREQVAGSAVKIFDANCPRKLLIIDAWVECTAAHASGTVTLDDGTSDITDAMVCAVDKTIVHAGTIDDAKATLAVGDTLQITPANSAAGEVFVLALPIA